MAAMKALIFDMDGLMIDSERLYFEVERAIARRYDKEVKDEILWRMMGRRPIEGLTIFVRELGLPLEPAEAVNLRNDLMREKMKRDLRPMPGLFHIIDCFYGRLKLAVSTAAPREFLDIAVDKLGIREKFDVLQASDDVRSGKPDPEIFLKACDKLKVAPEEAIVLEDSENGVIAGKRAGCTVIAVPSEYTRGQDFSQADCVAADLFEAEKYVSSLSQ
ncbi:MAG: HAD family phosphatase [Candidatus Aminicenantes bacterium]|nr:HAD family phosphatase [Candidatus Aminicenantes bacterium]